MRTHVIHRLANVFTFFMDVREEVNIKKQNILRCFCRLFKRQIQNRTISKIWLMIQAKGTITLSIFFIQIN